MSRVVATERDEQKASYYDHIYSKPYKTQRFNVIYDQVLEWVKEFPVPRILEIGCGTGVLGAVLFNLCEDRADSIYHGFDFSEAALDKCPELIQDAIFINDVYNQKIWNNYFDRNDYNIVVAVEVFEHIDDIRVLKMIPKGTRVIFSVPSFDSLPHLRTYPTADAISRWYGEVLEIRKHVRIERPRKTCIHICDSEKI